jgi:hypothetical protein
MLQLPGNVVNNKCFPNFLSIITVNIFAVTTDIIFRRGLILLTGNTADTGQTTPIATSP